MTIVDPKSARGQQIIADSATEHPQTQGDPPPDSSEDLAAHPWKRVSRLKLLLVLATMPSEAFGWLVITLSNARGGQVWPTGLGGFRPDSRESIAATRAAADELLETGGEDL